MWDCAANDQRERPKTRKKCGAGSAQRLLVDLELLGDIGLGDAESRGVLSFGKKSHFGGRRSIVAEARNACAT